MMLKRFAFSALFLYFGLAAIPSFAGSRLILENPVKPLSRSLSLPFNVAQSPQDPSWKEGSVELLTINAEIGGHSLPVRSVAFSSDGQFLVSGSADKTIKIWNLKNQSLEKTLSQNTAQVVTVAFSPDGRFLASGFLDGSVKLWDWKTGQLLSTFLENSARASFGHIITVAFSPDSQTLASGSDDKTIHLWDVNSRKLQSIIPTQQFIQTIAFSPNGEMLASAGIEKKVDLWDWKTGKLIRSLGPYGNAIEAIAFSPDAQRIVFSPDAYAASAPVTEQTGVKNSLRVWDLNGKQVGKTLQGHRDTIISVAFSPSGQTLISGSWDHTIKIWNVQSGEIVREFLENDRRILSVAFRPDGKAFALGSGDGSIKIFISEE
jgi:WD40 repeat protein